jgi:hypothetical protein
MALVIAGYRYGEGGYYDESDGSGPYCIDSQGRRVLQTNPQLFTDLNGPNSRLRVDVAQTGFFDGREFRTFKEFATSTTGTYVIRVESPVNVILFEFGGSLTAGSIKIELVAGGTEGGTFAEVLPRFTTNGMTTKPQPVYASQVSITAGGTLTGGVINDVFVSKVADNNTFSGVVTGDFGAERGSAPGVYYYRLTMTNVTGVVKGRWEERP